MDPLYHGTHPVQALRIFTEGIRPKTGYSPHATQTHDAVFLTDDIRGGLTYSHDKDGVAILEVDPDGLELVPDTDDIGDQLDAEWSEFSREFPGYKIGGRVRDEDAEAVCQWFDWTEGFRVLVYDPESQILFVEPWVFMPLQQPVDDMWESYSHELEFYDEYAGLLVQQWMCYCDVESWRIQAVWANEAALPSLYLSGLDLGQFESKTLTNFWENRYWSDDEGIWLFPEVTIYRIPRDVMLENL
jgi:hypothetical protein